MSQHDMDVSVADANTGATFRTQLNLALKALASSNSGDSEPTTTWAGMIWYDTLNGKVKIRKTANDGWNELWDISTTFSAFAYTLLDDLTAAAARATLGGCSPTGSITAFAGSSAPTGWLLCYGQLVSRTTYADLFAVIGGTWSAGDGSTTFGLPDLRGRVPLGRDNMGGSSANRITDTEADTVGASAGSENHLHTTGDVTLSAAQSGLPAHTHAIANRLSNSGSGADGITVGVNDASQSVTTGAVVGGAAAASTAHNHGNTQTVGHTMPYTTLNYIIKH